MAKPKKPTNPHKDKPAAQKSPPVDPYAVLRQPASPPRPRFFAFLFALAVFFAWFVFLVYVAVYGRV